MNHHNDSVNQRLDRYLHDALESIRQATNGITTEELAWHPERKWSAAEILEHLSLTFAASARGMKKALNSGAHVNGRRTLKQRIGAVVVTVLGHFPAGRKSPETVEPKTADPTTAVERAERELANMDFVLGEVERKMGSKVRVRHPILGPRQLPSGDGSIASTRGTT